MQHQFWINANSNALDVAVLEWCKLFAEYHGKHHWRNVVLNPAAFISGLCAALNVSVDQFQNYEVSVRRHRNKFVAHLDEEHVMDIPRMRIVRKSTSYLFNHLRNDDLGKQCLADAPTSAVEHYSVMYRQARQEYTRAT